MMQEMEDPVQLAYQRIKTLPPVELPKFWLDPCSVSPPHPVKEGTDEERDFSISRLMDYEGRPVYMGMGRIKCNARIALWLLDQLNGTTLWDKQRTHDRLSDTGIVQYLWKMHIRILYSLDGRQNNEVGN